MGANLFPRHHGVPYDVSFDLTQVEDSLSGLAFFETLDQPLAPTTIARDGSARTASHLQYLTSPIDVTWNLRQLIPGRIDGTLEMFWTNSVRSGTMTVTGELRDVVRTKATARGRSTVRGGVPRGWRSVLFQGQF